MEFGPIPKNNGLNPWNFQFWGYPGMAPFGPTNLRLPPPPKPAAGSASENSESESELKQKKHCTR